MKVDDQIQAIFYQKENHYCVHVMLSTLYFKLKFTFKGLRIPEWELESEKCNLVDGLNGISTWRVKEKCVPWSYEYCGLKIHVSSFMCKFCA
jgi:hypothetical protein